MLGLWATHGVAETKTASKAGADIRIEASLISRLTAEFSGRTRALQHAGGRTVRPARHWPPAAEQFMGPGPLQRFVRRQLARALVAEFMNFMAYFLMQLAVIAAFFTRVIALTNFPLAEVGNFCPSVL